MRSFPTWLASCFLLAGCDSLPAWMDTNPPAPPPLLQPQIQQPFSETQRWWKNFGDPLMDQLADQLIAQNIDIKIASARVDEARGLVRVAQSGWLPDIGLRGNATRGNDQIGATGPISIAKGGFDASWELDVFGRTRSRVSAAESHVDATMATAQEVKNSILSELFKAVIQWRQARQTVKETTALLTAQEDQVGLLRSRAKAGLVDSSFLERAQAEYAQTATELPLAQAQAETAQYQIERLLGKMPGELQSVFDQQPAKDLEVPPIDAAFDIPVDTIRNRPDLRAAKANMLAAQADLASAEADLWPRLTLGGVFGAQATSGAIPVADNPIWSLAAGLTAPLFNFGRLDGAVDANNARSIVASFEYENATLGALQEARTALSDYIGGINAVTRQGEALQHRRDAVSLANERFTRGLTDMTDLTTAQAELDHATLTLIERKAATAIAYIRLQKALGLAVTD